MKSQNSQNTEADDGTLGQDASNRDSLEQGMVS
jgi:hypothetical protein